MNGGIPAPDAEFFYALVGAICAICGIVFVILKIFQMLRPQPGARELAVRVEQIEKRLEKIESDGREDRLRVSDTLMKISASVGALGESIDALRQNFDASVKAQTSRSESDLTDIRSRLGRIEKQIAQRRLYSAPLTKPDEQGEFEL